MNPQRIWARIALLGAMLAPLAGCAKLTPPQPRAGDAPFDVIYSAPFRSIDPARRTTARLGRSAYLPRWTFLAHLEPAHPLPPPIKKDPRLDWWLRVLGPARRETLFVSFADTLTIPRFPSFDSSQPRSSRKNHEADSLTAIMVADLTARRQAAYAADTAGFATVYDAVLIKTYWLSQAALIEMPLGNVDALAARHDVLYIRPQRGNGPPGGPTYSVVDAICGRNRIGSDHFLDLGLGSGWIALLDTGVRTTHELLCDDSDRWCLVADCVSGDCSTASSTDCVGYTGCAAPDGIDRDPNGHGTSSAALLAGRGDIYDNRFGGVTRATLDCFTVYGMDDTLIAPSAATALELAARRGERVVLAEMQEPGTATVDLSAFAGHAFDAGAVVIAANGNHEFIRVNGESVPLAASIPARSRKVLGVGWYDVQTGGWDHGQAHGTTTDGRVKPDLIAPSSSQTAGDTSDSDWHGFGWTSGAAPYVAGAAMLLENWMAAGWEDVPIDPGQV